ncbi:MAG TPA: hypothetical protein VHC98_00100 [Candidatus Saccharimonadales bacterium]|nr:hypothetical protein [Candidatus Saccharimonadales bacterium]
MTRVLSELLGAQEPVFSQRLQRLEAASGHANTDIHLSAEIERATKLKLCELGLDPHDTTGQELYAALEQRVRRDDARLRATLRARYGVGMSPHLHVSKALAGLPVPKSCFALKTAVGKRLLAKNPPKQVMKALGYRSFDSMMRREQLMAVCAAAWLLESASWRKAMLAAYKKLVAADFEIRTLSILAPDSTHWQKLADVVVQQKKHNIIGLKEFGAVILLPLPAEKPPAATLAMLLLALHELNDVRAAGTFLKLCQVKPEFGRNVQLVVTDEPKLGAALLDGEGVPWQVVQRYYARFRERFRPELFEPHVQKEDLCWHSIEKALEAIEPSLTFWRHTTSLGLSDSKHQPVSLNIVDAALNLCNRLPYERRIVHYFRHSLWHELIIRYLKHEAVERVVLGSLESQLVAEPVVE